ncbi:MAG TPA: hypothetical protein VFG76_05220 [Candidatus Polarisedimenticolia bacterium]|nr:hypothetical protein [Candidatus Polarisedimenticolia bacterium]
MNSKMMKTHGFAALVLASTVTLAPAAHAQTVDVIASHLGSSGMVQAGPTSVKTARAILSPASSGTVVARYAVNPVALGDFPSYLHLVANMSDAGQGASISISLMEINLGKPGAKPEPAFEAAKAILTLNSEDLAKGELATQCAFDGGGIKLDFESKVYFIQAELTWDASVQRAAPQLRTVQLIAYPGEVCGERQVQAGPLSSTSKVGL